MLPSQLEQLLRYQQSKPDSVASLERVIVSGEPCTESLWHAFRHAFFDEDEKRYRCQLINLYGQTETTGDCCAAVLTSLPEDQVVVNHTVTIGLPIRNDIHIEGKATGDDQDLVELVVSGVNCLANGYLKCSQGLGKFDWDNVKKRFSFATGDTGFCKAALWYVRGRKDDVVKINGTWTCPSAIESAFLGYYREQTHCETQPTVAATVLDGRIYLLAEHGNNKRLLEFSRGDMKEQTRLPWNLIPHRVNECTSLPRTPGTGKIDRARIKQMVKRDMSGQLQAQAKEESDKATEEDSMQSLFELFLKIMATVLDCSAELDISKSFVDLGGDSALAVSLHYELRLLWWPRFLDIQFTKAGDPGTKHPCLMPLTPVDVLNSSTVKNIWGIATSGKQSIEKRNLKRSRSEKSDQPVPVFRPVPKIVWCARHESIEFAACVDAAPVVLKSKDHDTTVLAGCQNGLVQLVQCGRHEMDAKEYHQLAGFRISSDVLVENGRILVFANRHPKSSKFSPGGKISALSKDLSTEYWTKDLSQNQGIQSSPIICIKRLWVVICSKQDDAQSQCIQAFETRDDELIKECQIDLPVRVAAKPLLWDSSQLKRADGSTATTILIYASSDWETGLVFVDVERECLLAKNDNPSGLYFAGEIGPIYKTMALDAQMRNVFLSDSWGSLHKIDLLAMSIKSKKVSSYALSGPCIADNSSIIVGGYDGRVFSLCKDLATFLWSCNIHGTVYTTPLVLSDKSSVVVCTTAGDVYILNLFTGKEQWKYRLPTGGEIWSDPIEIQINFRGTNARDRRICFGARDSRLHFLDV